MSPATEQAIDWLLRLDADGASEADRQAFEQWLARASSHRQAWQALQERLQTSVAPALAQLRGRGAPAIEAGRQALLAPVLANARRRVLRGGLAGLLTGIAVGWLVHRQTPLTTLVADLRTGTGERLHRHLPDGSELTLDARSAADLAYDGTQRLVRLRTGALMAAVAPAGPGRPPFVVQSAQGTVQALGTRFMVRQHEDGHTLVHVLEHSVRVTTLAGQAQTLQAGESALFSERAIVRLAPGRQAPAAWADGLLDVRDLSLGEVIDELRPYVAGPIRVSPDAARLRVFGVFPLDRPEQVLQDLVDTHPVSVRRWGNWLTLVDVRKF